MDIKDYVPKVRGLINRLNTVEDDHLHMAMGMVGEIGEVVDILKKSFAYGKPLDKLKVLEELGDFTFYTVGLANMLGEGFEDFEVEDWGLRTSMALGTLVFSSGTVLMVVSEGEAAELRGEVMREALCVVHTLALDFGSSLDEIMDLNIKKLEARYPGLRFDVDRANNRDVEAEAKAMQQ